MKRSITILLSLLMTTLAFAQQPKTPSVSIENFQQPTPTSIEYDVVVNSDCNSYVYIHADAGLGNLAQGMGMSVEQYLQMVAGMLQWIPASAGQTDHYSFADFEMNTTYTAYVLARNAAGETTIVSHEFTTGEQGGEGQAQLSMSVTYPQDGKAHIDITINDQTAYYWYATLTDDILSNFGQTIASATTQDYYNVMNQFVNNYGMNYYIHTANISEDFTVGVNIEAGEQNVAVAFPFNSADELGTYTEPIIFSVSGSGPNSIRLPETVSVSVWPNPAAEILNVKAEEAISQVEMFDLQGRRLLVEEAASDTHAINLDAFSAGMYILKVKTVNGSSAKMVMVR